MFNPEIAQLCCLT